jgi:cell division protein FtsB
MSDVFMGLYIVVSLVAFFIYNKFEQSERAYVKLHTEYLKVVRERDKTKRRVKDLQSYKDDISKTFKILDNELAMINDHIKRKEVNLSEQSEPLGELRGNSLSVMLTPEILNGLFDGINSERIQSVEERIADRVNVAEADEERDQEHVESGQSIGIAGVTNRYDQFLI